MESQSCAFQQGARCPCLPGVWPDKYLKMQRSPNRRLLFHLFEGKHSLSKIKKNPSVFPRYLCNFSLYQESRTLKQGKLRAALLIGQQTCSGSSDKETDEAKSKRSVNARLIHNSFKFLNSSGASLLLFPSETKLPLDATQKTYWTYRAVTKTDLWHATMGHWSQIK